MKAFLLTVVCIFTCAGAMFAQNLPPDYYWEVGFNMGYSNFIRPTGNAQGYQGNRTNSSTDKALNLTYYLSPHWLLNLEFGERHWQSAGNWQVNDQLGQQLQTRPITFVEADHAINETVGISYVIPFYSHYNAFNRANLAFGVNFGLMQTTNDASTGFSKYNAPPDSSLMYLSKYDYASGQGYNLGIQVSYTWYIIPRLGINLDLGARYAHIKTIDQRYGDENAKFYTIYFPETLGLRWRF